MKRRFLSAIGAAMLGITMLVGCTTTGGTQPASVQNNASGAANTQATDKANTAEARYELDPNKPAWQIDPQENTKLTWYVNADWWNTEFGTDYVTKILKDDLNVDIVFQVGDDTKLNGLFGSGQLPDILTIFGSTTQTAKKADTWAQPLNDLADKYDPYFYKVIAQETFDWFKLGDGKTYGYPSYSNTTVDYEKGYLQATDFFVVREDVYNAIGKPEISDEEGFLGALKKIKEQYPDIAPFGMRSFGSGAAPTTSSIGNQFQDFLGVPIMNEDKTYYYRNLDPEYLRWIKIFNHAYLQGFISDDAFSDSDTVFEEKLASGRYGTAFITGAPQLSGTLQKNLEADAARKYIAIDGPQSSLGNKPMLAQSGISGWSVTYVTKNCTDPQKAIQLFTYLISDYGRQVCFFGKEGETYSVDENGKYYFVPEVDQMRKENPDNFKKTYRFGEFCLFGHDGYNIEHSKDGTIDSVKQMAEWGTGKLYPHFVLEDINPDPGTPEARNLRNIEAEWSTTLAKLLRAQNDAEFDKLIEDFKTFQANTGWDNIVKIFSDKMKISADKLGL